MKTLDITIVRDTVVEYKPIPLYIEKKIPIEIGVDTLSIIESDAVKSVAEYRKGHLFHAVVVLPKPIPVTVPIIERRREEDKPIIKEVEVNRLTKWLHRQIIGFWILPVLFIVSIYAKIKKII